MPQYSRAAGPARATAPMRAAVLPAMVYAGALPATAMTTESNMPRALPRRPVSAATGGEAGSALGAGWALVVISSPGVGAAWGSDTGPGLGEHRAQDLLYLVKVFLAADERRGELDHRVAPVVGAAYQPGIEQRVGQESAQQPLRLVVVERLPGGLVLDQLDAVEVASAADLPDDRQVAELLQGGAERGLVGPHVPQQVFLLEDVQVGQRHRGGYGVAGERDAVQERGRARAERLHQRVADQHPAERRVAGRDPLG